MTRESCVKLLSSTKEFSEALALSLESGKNEIENLLKPFTNYCNRTETVKKNAEQIEEKNVQMQCVNENLHKLNLCLKNIIENVYYEEKDEEYLLNVDLTNARNIPDIMKIATKLTESQVSTKCTFDKALLKSKAIHDQFQRLHKLREKFTLKVYQLFKNILSLSIDMKVGTATDDEQDMKRLAVHLLLPPKHLLTTSLSSSVSSSSSSSSSTATTTTATSIKSTTSAISLANLKYLKNVCENVHRNLHEYVQLMYWLRSTDSSLSDQFQKHYMDILSQFYEKLIRLVFEIESGRLPKKTTTAKSTAAGDTSTLLNISTLTSASVNESLNVSNLETSHFESSFSGVSSSHLFLLGAENFGGFAKTEIDDHILINCLNEVEDVFREEEQFFGSFFHNPSSAQSEKEAKKCLKHNLIQLFATFETELKQFNGHLELLNGGCFSMNILIDLSNFIVKDKNAMQLLNTSSGSNCSFSGSTGGQSPHYLNEVLAANLIQAKRSFDKFMNLQIQSVRDSKPSKRVPCGLLFYVQNLERFVTAGKPLLESQRRADLEKWYARLIDTMLEYVRIHAEMHSKTPPEVIRIENYHYLHSLLSQMKIASLQVQKKQAKTLYTEALEAYVARYFGKPLEKLNVFLDGVKNRLSAGVKLTEIQYQSAFSKQELRKVIQQYSKKEVNRGLEHLYRKMEKHFSDETNLTPVVWRAMEQEFISQYKTLDEMIQSCYPGSMISMEFTIKDILDYFAEIK